MTQWIRPIPGGYVKIETAYCLYLTEDEYKQLDEGKKVSFEKKNDEIKMKVSVGKLQPARIQRRKLRTKHEGKYEKPK